MGQMQRGEKYFFVQDFFLAVPGGAERAKCAKYDPDTGQIKCKSFKTEALKTCTILDPGASVRTLRGRFLHEPVALDFAVQGAATDLEAQSRVMLIPIGFLQGREDKSAFTLAERNQGSVRAYLPEKPGQVLSADQLAPG